MCQVHVTDTYNVSSPKFFLNCLSFSMASTHPENTSAQPDASPPDMEEKLSDQQSDAIKSSELYVEHYHIIVIFSMNL